MSDLMVNPNVFVTINEDTFIIRNIVRIIGRKDETIITTVDGCSGKVDMEHDDVLILIEQAYNIELEHAYEEREKYRKRYEEKGEK